jgi:hypothetical protein
MRRKKETAKAEAAFVELDGMVDKLNAKFLVWEEEAWKNDPRAAAMLQKGIDEVRKIVSEVKSFISNMRNQNGGN